LNRLYEEKLNNQGCPMKIVEYNSYSDIIVEFQDEYKYRTNTIYANFKSGSIRNPYYPSIYGIGITGCKYPTKINSVSTKEYLAWIDMLKRCFIEKTKNKQPSYKEVECCKEWLNFEVFCDWLHSQPNYDKWKNGYRWAIDKDILVRGNKIYGPSTCCLVPRYVNNLFIKRDRYRGDYPIGVIKYYNKFRARCEDILIGKRVHLGLYDTPEKAFSAYKKYKEMLIKKIAQIEFEQNHITKECYNAMMNYKVDITD
jgi:hypothetical protein